MPSLDIETSRLILLHKKVPTSVKSLFKVNLLQAEGPGVAREKFWKKKFRIFLAYDTPRPPLSVHKKFQPNRSSRLAGYREHKYDCLVLLYRFFVVAGRGTRCRCGCGWMIQNMIWIKGKYMVGWYRTWYESRVSIWLNDREHDMNQG